MKIDKRMIRMELIETKNKQTKINQNSLNIVDSKISPYKKNELLVKIKYEDFQFIIKIMKNKNKEFFIKDISHAEDLSEGAKHCPFCLKSSMIDICEAKLETIEELRNMIISHKKIRLKHVQYING